MLRILGAEDAAALEEFLAGHADSSMFLRANASHGGLVDRGETLQATYAALFDGGAIRAVAAHAWNGTLLLQAPERVAEVASEALRATRRPLNGIAGPWTQAQTAAAAVGASLRGLREVLYALDLDGFRYALAAGLTARRPRTDELEHLTTWREAYLIETGLGRPGSDLRGIARASVALWHALGNDWVLDRGGEIVAYTGFNARVADMAQVGGVYTPPPLRRCHFARAAVATHLLAAGLRRAVLFTPETNVAARRAYEALGFRAVGDYGLLMP